MNRLASSIVSPLFCTVMACSSSAKGASEPATPIYHCYLQDAARPDVRTEFTVETTNTALNQATLGDYEATLQRSEGVDSDGLYNVTAKLQESGATYSEIAFAVGTKWVQVAHGKNNQERVLLACSTWQ